MTSKRRSARKTKIRKDRSGSTNQGPPAIQAKPPGRFKMLFKRVKPDSIFKDNRVDIAPGKIITEPFEVLSMYALDRHRQKFEDERDSCPFNTDLETEELVFKQQMTWFLFVRKDPSTGITIVEEFINEQNIPEELAEELMQPTKMFPGHFKVVKRKRRDIVLYDTDRHKEFLVSTRNPSAYPPGCIVLGCIHPYEGKYKLCGIPTIAIPP